MAYDPTTPYQPQRQTWEQVSSQPFYQYEGQPPHTQPPRQDSGQNPFGPQQQQPSQNVQPYQGPSWQSFLQGGQGSQGGGSGWQAPPVDPGGGYQPGGSGGPQAPAPQWQMPSFGGQTGTTDTLTEYLKGVGPASTGEHQGFKAPGAGYAKRGISNLENADTQMNKVGRVAEDPYRAGVRDVSSEVMSAADVRAMQTQAEAGTLRQYKNISRDLDRAAGMGGRSSSPGASAALRARAQIEAKGKGLSERRDAYLAGKQMNAQQGLAARGQDIGFETTMRGQEVTQRRDDLIQEYRQKGMNLEQASRAASARLGLRGQMSTEAMEGGRQGLAARGQDLQASLANQQAGIAKGGLMAQTGLAERGQDLAKYGTDVQAMSQKYGQDAGTQRLTMQLQTQMQNLERQLEDRGMERASRERIQGQLQGLQRDLQANQIASRESIAGGQMALQERLGTMGGQLREQQINNQMGQFQQNLQLQYSGLDEAGRQGSLNRQQNYWSGGAYDQPDQSGGSDWWTNPQNRAALEEMAGMFGGGQAGMEQAYQLLGGNPFVGGNYG